MSVASEELARDNCVVSDEVVQLREDKASQAQNLDALQVSIADVAIWFVGCKSCMFLNTSCMKGV